MSDAATPRHSLPYLAAGQAQKHVTLNEALARLDGLVQTAVESRAVDEQPADPGDGALHILPDGAGGDDWAGEPEGALMRFEAGAWTRLAVAEGHIAWVKDEALAVVFDGEAWGELVTTPELTLLGVNATADTTNRLAISSDAVLFNHAGAGSQVKVNKDAAGDTASHLFQTGFSGRAEFGLAGSDDFSIKVSPDGSAWHDVMSVDRATGRATFALEPRSTENPDAPVSLAFAATLTPDLADGRAFLVTATDDFDLEPPDNLTAGTVFWLRITQDGTGGREATFDAGYRFPGGSAPALSAAASAADMLYCVVVDAAAPIIDAALRKGV